MKKHIQKATDTFMDGITRNVASPATSYLFKTREDATTLWKFSDFSSLSFASSHDANRWVRRSEERRTHRLYA